MNLTLLALKNALRERVRSTLTVLGIAVGVLTLLILGTALRSWDTALDMARKDRLVTRHKVTFILPLPKRYVDEVRAAKDDAGNPLARHVTFASWFGGRVPGRERDFFATYAVDPATYFDVYDEVEVAPAELEAFRGDRRAAIVGEALLRDFGWKIGDTVTLESAIYPAAEEQPWSFTIAGTYRPRSSAVDKQTFLFHWDYLNEGLPPHERDNVGWIVSRTLGESAAAAATVLDGFFDDRDTQTLSQDERTFANGFLGMVSAVLDVVAILAGFIVVILALILANTVAMSVNERSAELASLKALGFGAKHLAWVVLVEAAVLALLGSLAGLGLGVVVIDFGLGRFFEENLAFLFPVFRLEAGPAAAAVAVSVLASVAAAAIPAASASRIHVIEALRRAT